MTMTYKLNPETYKLNPECQEKCDHLCDEIKTLCPKIQVELDAAQEFANDLMEDFAKEKQKLMAEIKEMQRWKDYATWLESSWKDYAAYLELKLRDTQDDNRQMQMLGYAVKNSVMKELEEADAEEIKRHFLTACAHALFGDGRADPECGGKCRRDDRPVRYGEPAKWPCGTSENWTQGGAMG